MVEIGKSAYASGELSLCFFFVFFLCVCVLVLIMAFGILLRKFVNS